MGINAFQTKQIKTKVHLVWNCGQSLKSNTSLNVCCSGPAADVKQWWANNDFLQVYLCTLTAKFQISPSIIFSVEGWLGLVWYFGGCAVHSKPRVWARVWCFLSLISAIKSWVWKDISYGGDFGIQWYLKNTVLKDVVAVVRGWYFSVIWIVKSSVWKDVIVCLFRMIVKERFMLWRVERCETWYRVCLSNRNSYSNSASSIWIVESSVWKGGVGLIRSAKSDIPTVHFHLTPL